MHSIQSKRIFNDCIKRFWLVNSFRLGQVFGAYCSTNWKERNAKDPHGGRQGYFGTGETFVFTLHPQEVKYPWVGIQAQSSSDGPAVVRHAAELFMASDNHMVTIGGG